MSLTDQLGSLKKSIINVFDVDIKNRKSLINKNGLSMGRMEVYQKCIKAYKKLCTLDNRFLQFESLYSEKSIDMSLQLLKPEEFEEIKKSIQYFLCIATSYLETESIILALEWLVYKYEIYLHQPEDILMSCLPYHNHKIFLKLIRLFDFRNSNNQFSWLKTFSVNGRTISPLDLSSMCLKYPNVLEMICNWPIKINQITENDQTSCQELCHVIITLGINILDKVKFFSSDKIEKYLSPFVRLIIDGLNIVHDNLNSCAIILLVYFSEVISLDRKFLNRALKKILKSGSLDMFIRLRAVLDVCHFQQLQLTTKLESLFNDSLEKLSEKERKLIDELRFIKPEEFNETENTIIEPMEITTNNRSNKKEKKIITETPQIESIDWTSPDIEKQLIELLNENILNWLGKEMDAKLRLNRNPSKMCRDLLRSMKLKPKEFVFEYSPGGLIGHLCLAVMYPDIKVKKLVIKIINKFAHNWPNHNKFASSSSSVAKGILDGLTYGALPTVILEELDKLDLTTVTSSVTCLSMINSSNIGTIISSMPKIWDLFLDKLRPIRSMNHVNFLYRDCLLHSLRHLGDSFTQLSSENQIKIIDHILFDINRNTIEMSTAIDYLVLLPLSVDHIKYLLLDSKSSNTTGKSVKKFKGTHEPTATFFSEQMQIKINVVLSAFSRSNTLNVENQLNLVDPIISILSRIVSHLFRTKLVNNEPEQACTDSVLIELVSNVMSAMQTILVSVMESKETPNLQVVSDKIRVELFSKCLYLFQNPYLNELNLSVIQNIVKLGLGLDQFNLIYFISWIGNHLVPCEDQHSMNILTSIIDETLPLCIKQKESSSDKVQIIVKFVNECSTIPKHRVVLFFESLVKSLSKSGDCDSNNSALWIQLIFMIAIKVDKSAKITSQNECLIIPLLSRFSIEEQIFTLQKVIGFLSHLINDPSRKRKFIDEEISSSPLNKKRKTEKSNVPIKSVIGNGYDADFTVKCNLLSIDKDMDFANILQTMIKYSLIHFKDNSDHLVTASTTILKDFISSIFSSMKLINRSNQTVQRQNEFSQLLRQIIECVGSLLSKNVYLSMIVELSFKDTDECVKSKCLELLASKLGAMTKSIAHVIVDAEFIEISRSLFPLATDILINHKDSVNWNSALLCVTHLMILGLGSDKIVQEPCEKLFNHLLVLDPKKLVADKVIVINMFFKQYLTTDKYEELAKLLNWSLVIVDKCIANSNFKNGEVESSLALIHAIISQQDSQSIGWEILEKVLMKIFELVTLDCKIKSLSKQSCDYQKFIRIKLSKLSDTRSLIRACVHLTEIGLANENLTFISGSISLFGCHLSHLNKSGIRCQLEDEEMIWDLIYRSLSLNEVMVSDHGSGLNDILEISIKALDQFCHLFEFDSVITEKLFTWTQKSDISQSFYLQRNSVLFQFMGHHVSRSNNKEKSIEFINQSDCVSCASTFFKHLSVEVKSKSKRRKTQSSFVIPFANNELYSNCPSQCADLIKSICNCLISLLSAENKCGMNLSISDETIDLISSVCRNMLSIDHYLEKDDYKTVSENYLIPLIIQLASNSLNDEALLTPLAMGLCKHFVELSPIVHLTVLKTLNELKTCLGQLFDSSIRDHVSSFLEDCKLHDDEAIADLANEI